jgi:hypothetical protein
LKQLTRLGILALIVTFFGVTLGIHAQNSEITLFELAELLKQDRVESITVRGGVMVLVELFDGSGYQFTKQMEDNLFDKLRALGVTDQQLWQVDYVETQGDMTVSLSMQLLVAVISAALWLPFVPLMI